MPTALLLYTAEAEHDVLGHAIARLEDGTFTHSALFRDGVLLEAVLPKVRLRTGQDAMDARDGASEIVPFEPFSEALDAEVWSQTVEELPGRGYSLSTLGMDLLANVFQRVFALLHTQPWELRRAGELVCSFLSFEYARLILERRLRELKMLWRASGLITPADLGQIYVGRRLHREAA